MPRRAPLLAVETMRHQFLEQKNWPPVAPGMTFDHPDGPILRPELAIMREGEIAGGLRTHAEEFARVLESALTRRLPRQ